jgi:hypothetical protein
MMLSSGSTLLFLLSHSCGSELIYVVTQFNVNDNSGPCISAILNLLWQPYAKQKYLAKAETVVQMFLVIVFVFLPTWKVNINSA